MVNMNISAVPSAARKPGPGQRGLASKLVGNWSANAIMQLATGRPFTPMLATPMANTGTSSRPDRVARGRLEDRTTDRWFDTRVFVTPACSALGTRAETS